MTDATWRNLVAIWVLKIKFMVHILIFNSLAPGRSWHALLIGIFKSSYDNVFRWMSHNLTDDKSTLVQVMAWCRQATSHYLNQCWPRSSTPYGVTRPQWVKSTMGWGVHYRVCQMRNASKTTQNSKYFICLNTRIPAFPCMIYWQKAP